MISKQSTFQIFPNFGRGVGVIENQFFPKFKIVQIILGGGRGQGQENYGLFPQFRTFFLWHPPYTQTMAHQLQLSNHPPSLMFVAKLSTSSNSTTAGPSRSYFQLIQPPSHTPTHQPTHPEQFNLELNEPKRKADKQQLDGIRHKRSLPKLSSTSPQECKNNHKQLLVVLALSKPFHLELLLCKKQSWYTQEMQSNYQLPASFPEFTWLALWPFWPCLRHFQEWSKN